MKEQRRIASIYLSHWPIDRFCRAVRTMPRRHGLERPTHDTALALAMPMQGGLRITAVTKSAHAKGITQGQLVADAMALYPMLDIRDTDLSADRAALDRLSSWCGRYTPWTATDDYGLDTEPDGIFMDISGCAHLFGNEDALAHDLISRFAQLHIHARISITSTPGAAWALARFGGQQQYVLPVGQEQKALAPLPVAALRLSRDAVDGLARLGLKRIDDLYGRARAPLTARFGRAVSRRLDEALGYAAEPISPQQPLVPYRARLLFAEGLTRIDDIGTAARQLADELCVLLERYHKGARRLELRLYRVDGEVIILRAGTSAPSRDAAHLARLFHEKLQQAGSDFDAGFGIEAMNLAALVADPLTHRQTTITDETARTAEIDGLIDRLGNRLGPARVLQLAPHASHIPERAVRTVTMLRGTQQAKPQDWHITTLPQHEDTITRPLRILSTPEPVEVTAEIPEGPPRRFRWRRVLYQVARAEGPERIAPEWWRGEHSRTRDYYRIEDVDGRRFWLFRDGLYTRDHDMPHWYIQGIFG